MRQIAFLWLSLVCAQVIASPMDDLSEKLTNLKSLEASFTQSIESSNGQRLAYSEGYLKVLRPGRFYWKSERPDEMIVLADGKTIWNYDVELEQIVQRPQGSALGQSPAALLANQPVNLSDNYLIKALAQCEGDLTCYELKPKDPESGFQSATLGFDGQKIVLIRIHDALDQTILTRFTNVKLNVEVDESVFDFEIPEGVDVLKAQD